MAALHPSGQDQVAVVTGATGGIGRWIALGLARAGYATVLVGRDAGRLEAATAWIADQVPGARLHPHRADLSSLAETRALARAITAGHPRLALLVNNAGTFQSRRSETAEGRELVLATNHLSPFLLARELMPALRRGAPARLVTVGSSTADTATIDPADLELRRGWGLKRSYARSKLAATIATVEWARRLPPAEVTANVVHPGTVATGLVRTGGIIGLAWKLMAPWSRTAEQGADTPLFVALDPALAGTTGLYFKDRRPACLNPLALDPDLAGRVWDETERLVG